MENNISFISAKPYLVDVKATIHDAMKVIEKGEERICFIVDDNKFKQNKFCPGSKIPIRSINALSKIEQNLVIVPLAWNFYSEIKSKVIKLRKNKKDKFLVCFPKLKLDKV